MNIRINISIHIGRSRKKRAKSMEVDSSYAQVEMLPQPRMIGFQREDEWVEE